MIRGSEGSIEVRKGAVCGVSRGAPQLHFAAAVRVLLYLQHSASRTLVYHLPRHQSKMRPLEIYVDSDWRDVSVV